ncbi:hypothetical protein DYBT9275_00297 [Dyadobacter sp. CECT 9275]|uniref:AprE-like beta-barrel domain-containing protein n=1 Tax=Dyadobacter helix TaxID=2822344 RepID=A0A916J871_9BACT|nr:HlyD family efflux transporter periplasmic adaptor subunit [Dyadobacter sp. CECT 9275]CAG4989459.1 hypothetical protein DYBT9275_00297 [Dyadobacter sp. CECT 9275]
MEGIREEDIDTWSEAVRDFIEQPPQWLVRWGTLSLFAVIVAASAIGWVIHYPTIVRTDFRLISDNLPKPVLLKVDGRIEDLFVRENQRVQVGNILAYVESTARHDEILDLERGLNEIGLILKGKDLSRLSSIRLNRYEHLGDVQSAYQNFQQAFVQVRTLYGEKFYSKKRRLLLNDIIRSETLDQHLTDQQKIYVRDAELAEKEFGVNRKLHNSKVIADLDLYKEESKALAKQLPIKNIEVSRVNNNTQKNAKQSELLELDRTVYEQTEGFGQALNTLRSTIESWKSKYLLTAPASGNIFFSTTMQEKQSLRVGAEVMYVGAPTNNYLGEIRIIQANSGLVNVGQRVLVKFQGYPFEEYGAVEGTVSSIAKVPSADNSYFLANVFLPNGLKTNFGRTLVYKTGMSASAEIVTEELRLIERLFYQGRRMIF